VVTALEDKSVEGVGMRELGEFVFQKLCYVLFEVQGRHDGLL
jgi:hypothetical protein